MKPILRSFYKKDLSKSEFSILVKDLLTDTTLLNLTEKGFNDSEKLRELVTDLILRNLQKDLEITSLDLASIDKLLALLESKSLTVDTFLSRKTLDLENIKLLKEIFSRIKTISDLRSIKLENSFEVLQPSITLASILSKYDFFKLFYISTESPKDSSLYFFSSYKSLTSSYYLENLLSSAVETLIKRFSLDYFCLTFDEEDLPKELNMPVFSIDVIEYFSDKSILKEFAHWLINSRFKPEKLELESENSLVTKFLRKRISAIKRI